MGTRHFFRSQNRIQYLASSFFFPSRKRKTWIWESEWSTSNIEEGFWYIYRMCLEYVSHSMKNCTTTSWCVETQWDGLLLLPHWEGGKVSFIYSCCLHSDREGGSSRNHIVRKHEKENDDNMVLCCDVNVPSFELTGFELRHGFLGEFYPFQRLNRSVCSP